MTLNQKNNLLFSLAHFKAKLYNFNLDTEDCPLHTIKDISIIERNITSIEKQIKKF